MVKIVEKLLRAGEGRTLKKLHGLATQVNALEEDFARLTDGRRLFVKALAQYRADLAITIGAAALVRPSKSVIDLEVKSVKKKYRTPAFAAGCSREVIERGAGMLGWELDDLIGRTILAMRSCEKDYESI